MILSSNDDSKYTGSVERFGGSCSFVCCVHDGMHAGNADVPFELHRQPSCLCRFLNSSARNRTSPFPFSCHAPHSSRRSVCVRG